MPKRRLDHRKRPKRDAFQQHVSRMGLRPSRSDWQQLLDLTAASAVQSADVIGLMADYLISHRFEDSEHTSKDGKAFRAAGMERGWHLAVSEFPICLSSANDFSVMLRDVFPKNDRDPRGWSVGVGLWNKETPIKNNALFVFADFKTGSVDSRPEEHTCHETSSFTIRVNALLLPNTAVDVTYDPSANSCTFAIAGHASPPIKMPQDTPPNKWFPTVVVYSSPTGRLPYCTSVTLL